MNSEFWRHLVNVIQVVQVLCVLILMWDTQRLNKYIGYLNKRIRYLEAVEGK